MSPVPLIPDDLWQQIPPAARAAVLAAVRHYEARIAALGRRLAELDERLNQNSANSSQPPSADGPAVKRSPPKPPSGRRGGGQPGHPRQQRPLLPPDHVVPLKPSVCRGCGHALAGDDPQPLRHQVLELPPLRPVVTEYQRHRLGCPRCGLSTCAALPTGVPTGQQGPRLQAVVTLLTGAYRLSKRTAEALCADVLGVPLSAGQVCAVERAAVAATEPVVAPLREHVRGCDANADETSWREGGRPAWLWTVVTASVTVFHLAASRGAKVIRAILGAGYTHVLTSDRWTSYRWVPPERRQACWAHLRRDFQAMIDRHDAGSKVGADLLLLSDLLFNAWHRVRDGTLTRQTFARRAEHWYRPDVRATLHAGSRCGSAKTAATCRALLAVEPTLWTFVRADGVEPTNNAAERALRHAVQWRKTSYGTASAAGSRFVANVLSVVATCRQQGRGVLELLTDCFDAHLHGTTPPSLLPLANG